MAIREDLIEQITLALGNFAALSLVRSPQNNDLFEGYVFGIILDAVRKEDGHLFCYEDVHGNQTNTILFRTSPGYIFSQKPPDKLPDNEKYTHAVVGFAGKAPLEIHVGVRVEGKSRVLHECDVVVLARSEGTTCRQAKVIPRHSKVLLAVECKFYARNIELNLARAFMGLSTDISTQSDGRSESYFVMNTSSTSCEKLLTKHNKNWEHHISPNSVREVERLRNAFQRHFRNYKALD